MAIPNKDAIVEVPIQVIGRTAAQLKAETPEEPDWLVPGVLARGSTTELNAREKTGKGWFLAYLIGRMENGDPTIFGPTDLGPVRTLIFTEEPDQSLREKFDKFNINDSFVVYHWELAGMPWDKRVEWLTNVAIERAIDLVYIDNISSATGTEDENGVELARKVEPLSRKAKEHKLAFLYDRHQRKSGGAVEDRMRGGTALAGAVDQIIAMEKAPGNERKLNSWGRLWAHQWNTVVELNEEHDDFVNLGDTDWKVAKLLERSEWTAKEFAEVIKQTDESARQYLDGSPITALRREKRGNAKVWDVIKPFDGPELS